MNREELEKLVEQVRQLSLTIPIQDAEFQKKADELTGQTNAVAKVQELCDEIYAERYSLIDDLQKVVSISEVAGFAMPETRKLIVSLEGGLDTPDPLIFKFGAVVELVELAGKSNQVTRKSRQQPDKPVTTYVRKNLHKYESQADAIRAYQELHGGTFKTLRSQVKNDLHNRPLLKSLLKRKKTS